MPVTPVARELNAPRHSGGPRPVPFVATLALAMGIGPFAVNAVTAMSPLVLPDLGISRTQLGSLATVTFAVAAAGSWLGGRFFDRYTARSILVAVFVTGGLAVGIIASAVGMLTLWLAAVFGGLSQVIANPVTNRLIATHTPPGRQGVQIGVKQSGVQMVQALVAFTLPTVALVAGWRQALLVGVALALVGVVASLAAVPGEGHHAGGPKAGGSADGAALPAGIVWLAVYTGVMAMGVLSTVVYAPLYAYEGVGLTPVVAGAAVGALAAAGVVARIVWSRQVERQASPAGTLRVLAAAAFVATLLVMAGEHIGAWAMWLGLICFGGSATAVNAVAMIATIRACRGQATGRASGVVGMGLFGGFMVGPLLFGAVVDASGGRYAAGWGGVAACCAVALLVALLWRPQRAAAATG